MLGLHQTYITMPPRAAACVTANNFRLHNRNPRRSHWIFFKRPSPPVLNTFVSARRVGAVFTVTSPRARSVGGVLCGPFTDHTGHPWLTTLRIIGGFPLLLLRWFSLWQKPGTSVVSPLPRCHSRITQHTRQGALLTSCSRQNYITVRKYWYFGVSLIWPFIYKWFNCLARRINLFYIVLCGEWHF